MASTHGGHSAPLAGLPFRVAHAAAELARATGLGDITTVTELSGGANNRVHRLDTQRGTALLKQYFRHAPISPVSPISLGSPVVTDATDTPEGQARQHDRLGTEYAFLQGCLASGVRRVPRPLGCDAAHGIALYEYVVGTPLRGQDPDTASSQISGVGPNRADRPNRPDVAEAAAFLKDLQRADRRNFSMALAADACTTTADHLVGVARRLEALEHALAAQAAGGDAVSTSAIDAPDAALAQARTFLHQHLLPWWREVRRGVETVAGPDELARPVGHILSPSDFGFHNALRTPGGLVFLDFEYAGLDDPAKTLCDFACQPAVPVPAPLLDSALEMLAEAAEPDPTRRAMLLRRVRMLLPVHHVKWCCIMLNDFKTTDDARRRFSLGGDAESRRVLQLEKARHWLKTRRNTARNEESDGLR